MGTFVVGAKALHGIKRVPQSSRIGRLLRFRPDDFIEAAALRAIVLRNAGVPIATRVFFFPLLFIGRCRFFRVFFVPLPFSLCF